VQCVATIIVTSVILCVNDIVGMMEGTCTVLITGPVFSGVCETSWVMCKHYRIAAHS